MDKRWTYKVTDMKAALFGHKPEAIEEELKSLGLQGWELVAVMPVGTTARVFLKKEM